MNIDFEENLFEPEEDKDDQYLFADESEVEKSATITGKENAPKQTDRWKVLVVDDEEDVHSITRMALKGFTYKEK